MYQNMIKEGYLTPTGYKKILNTLSKKYCRFDIAKDIINVDGLTFPTLLRDLLLNVYNEYPTPWAYFSNSSNGSNTYDPSKVVVSQSYIGIDAYNPTNIFDFSIRRGGLGAQNNDRATKQAIDSGDGANTQIIRISRTLAALLGIDYWWCNYSYYPQCTFDNNNTPNTWSQKYKDALMFMTTMSSRTFTSSQQEQQAANKGMRYCMETILN